MKITTYLLAVFTLFPVAPHLFAQSADTDHVPEVNRKYQLLREDEDWSFLKDPKLREDFWDPIKYIPLRKSADDWYMNMGGEAREVWEQIGNDNWGESPYWNGYLDERYMPYFDLHYGRHLRTFADALTVSDLPKSTNSFAAHGLRWMDGN